MSLSPTDPNKFSMEGSQSLLEGILISEYLFCKGYLDPDFIELPEQFAKSLMSEARRFAALRMAEIMANPELSQKFRLLISLN
jgi:hypothetical protein